MMFGYRGVLCTPYTVLSSKGVLSTPLQTRGKYQVGWVYQTSFYYEKQSDHLIR
ncbi:hypothetical protein [Moraxella lacunata]|uniref:hypothetical protein n=1 Tax=Moraxella lacunata TaxID=477 RepID=UPI001301D9EF|nr:hypothetical protein [Moraxella lacunata]